MALIEIGGGVCHKVSGGELYLLGVFGHLQLAQWRILQSGSVAWQVVESYWAEHPCSVFFIAAASPDATKTGKKRYDRNTILIAVIPFSKELSQ